jgi:hypothetical protein
MPVSGFEHHTMECGDIERRLLFTREKQSISPSHRRKIERVVKMARPHLHICDGDRSCRVLREERCDAQEARRESGLPDTLVLHRRKLVTLELKSRQGRCSASQRAGRRMVGMLLGARGVWALGREVPHARPQRRHDGSAMSNFGTWRRAAAMRAFPRRPLSAGANRHYRPKTTDAAHAFNRIAPG